MASQYARSIDCTISISQSTRLKAWSSTKNSDQANEDKVRAALAVLTVNRPGGEVATSYESDHIKRELALVKGEHSAIGGMVLVRVMPGRMGIMATSDSILGEPGSGRPPAVMDGADVPGGGAGDGVRVPRPQLGLAASSAGSGPVRYRLFGILEAGRAQQERLRPPARRLGGAGSAVVARRCRRSWDAGCPQLPGVPASCGRRFGLGSLAQESACSGASERFRKSTGRCRCLAETGYRAMIALP